MADDEIVRAAGGVVVRRPEGAPAAEVLLVHRPRYDDWTFPKGKCDPGESDVDAARREVLEETGHECVLGRELPGIDYRDRHGRPKRVRYWEMTVRSGSFEPNDEVDVIRWVSLDEARRMLTYRRDVALVDAVC